MEDPTNNRLEKMLAQTQPDLKKMMDQLRPAGLTSTFDVAKGMESLKAADSPLIQLSEL
jgi:hypothetical protein